MSVIVGTRITTSAVFKPSVSPANPKPVPTDPGDVKLRVQAPDGTTADVVDEIVHVSEGVFLGSFTADTDGEWQWQWIATGDVEVVSDPTTVTVRVGLPDPV